MRSKTETEVVEEAKKLPEPSTREDTAAAPVKPPRRRQTVGMAMSTKKATPPSPGKVHGERERERGVRGGRLVITNIYLLLIAAVALYFILWCMYWLYSQISPF